MDTPFDQFGRRLNGLAAQSDKAGIPAPLDWPGLVARLAAAHAARRVLIVARDPGHSSSGSFAPDIADDLAGWRECSKPAVNLTAKADGKPPRPIPRNDAGEDRSIVRG